MLKLEDIKAKAIVTGLERDQPAQVVSIESIGVDAANVVYRTLDGRLGERMVFRAEEATLSLTQAGRPWSFDAPGDEFKLATEAYRIRLAHLFDPMMAVHTSDVEPLPHQVSAVYEAMLPRQPLRFVLADDPGAGKTIMAGLFIRELMLRADAHRVLVVAPGSLSGQWQDELWEKFGLHFEIYSRDAMEASPTRNYFSEHDRVIARLDQLSRNDEIQERLKQTHWDLIIVDEAHKLSANFYGSKVNKTKRFELGELLGSIARHFLLMTATPHNGKEEDFQLFLSLLDSDRFYGKFREGAHKVDVTDLMRRMVKEDLLRFDGRPLFPERKAYTANYQLSQAELSLYANVTDYVRNEMNRADRLTDKRRGTVGFALTLLQRRLASSPEAIYQSLKRRHRRLEERLNELKATGRGRIAETVPVYRKLDVPENIDEAEDALTAEELEAYSEQVVDQATASETIAELEAEIARLRMLEHEAAELVRSGNDRKWDQLSRILHDQPEMRDANGDRRKLIVFTEHRDTLNYLRQRIGDFLGKPEAIVTIHGGTNRDDRRRIQEMFRQDKDVLVLVATDAAGEGVNLQVANLMVNYDLPWNPNRIEQRFGRIHRIGQREVCHLWNLVAAQTREGEVFHKLFEKIEIEKKALGGRVFDVLGEAFDDVSLRDLLVQAIRFGEQPEVRARLDRVIETKFDHEHLTEILKRNALVDNSLTLDALYALKDEMDKAEARRLQPHFVQTLFAEAFKRLGGELRSREQNRFEIPHVPAAIRERDRSISNSRTPVLTRYARVCFEKQFVRPGTLAPADMIHPAHPLMAAVLDLILDASRARMKQGAILVDPADDSTTPRLLLLIDHSVREGSGDAGRVVSRRLQFVSIKPDGTTAFAGWAPHLDLRPIADPELAQVSAIVEQPWLGSDLEQRALAHASESIVPEHFTEVRDRRQAHIKKTRDAVRERLVKEINHLAHRALTLADDVKAGRQPNVQPENLRRRAEELTARLQQRERELEAASHIVSEQPMVVGGALVIPQGLLNAGTGGTSSFAHDEEAKRRIERIAMDAVLAHETSLGHMTRDVSAEKCGWDVTATPPPIEGRLSDSRLIEVKGRVRGATSVTVTRNEVMCCLNKPEQFYLAIVTVDEDGTFEGPYYLRRPFTRELDWSVTSVNLDLDALIARAESQARAEA